MDDSTGGAGILACIVFAAYSPFDELIRIASGDKNVPTQRFDNRQECLPHLALPSAPARSKIAA